MSVSYVISVCYRCTSFARCDKYWIPGERNVYAVLSRTAVGQGYLIGKIILRRVMLRKHPPPMPLFRGESGVVQLVEIIKIFHKQMPTEAVDLVSRLLQYSPNMRCTAVSADAVLDKFNQFQNYQTFYRLLV
ncbi:hypothetical protein SADUNF_Sadunf11G0074100 [Salix dunnii]|uniref:Uncharacterized protein n=1 Tax=Salix dunnii TaxID=1413687 RepID=A0A835JQE0_9ROSI|nr:hypothetical protein SADUNF_Sadunf11G0074100 [Salix dunnii]